MSITRSAPPRGRPIPDDDHQLDRHWRAELDDFERFRQQMPGGTYADWRPASWQAAGRAIGDALDLCASHGNRPSVVTELGCGAAGLLLQLACRDLVAMGVDRSSAALELAARAASTMRPVRDPSWCLDDFLRPGFAEIVPPADLVVSAGVLERYSAVAQEEVFDVHAALSHRWVLVVTANPGSPVFRSYLAWAHRHDRSQYAKPADVDVPALAAAAGHRVVATGGCGVFLDSPLWYATAEPALEAVCARLRERLVAEGGPRFGGFPRVDLGAADVALLDRVEAALSADERLRFGARRYHLVEVDHPAVPTRKRVA